MPVTRESQQDDFTQIPNAIIRDWTLSMSAFRVWIVGMSHVESWNFRRDDLAEKCGISPHTLLSALNELRDRGMVSGDFRNYKTPLTFHQDHVNVQNLHDNVQNLHDNVQNLHDQDHANVQNLHDKRAKSARSNVQNLHDKNTKEEYIKNTNSAALEFTQATEPCASEAESNAAAAAEEPNVAEGTTTDPRAIPTSMTAWNPDVINSIPDDNQAYPETAAVWEMFLSAWNASGQLPYTALQPTSLILHGFLRLNHLYGRDGPKTFIDQVTNSVWLRDHPQSLEWSLREQNVTKIMDGQYKRKFGYELKKTGGGTRDRSREIPDYAAVVAENGKVEF